MLLYCLPVWPIVAIQGSSILYFMIAKCSHDEHNDTVCKTLFSTSKTATDVSKALCSRQKRLQPKFPKQHSTRAGEPTVPDDKANEKPS